MRSIQNRIYELRGERVMLDFDLAELYEVEVRVLNQSVKRNIKRFPKDFMFQLTKDEYESLRFQIETSKTINPSRSQIVILKTEKGQNRKFMPYAFTEQGVAMLSGILNSERAIKMNIAIMRAFVEIRKVLLHESDLKEQLKQIKERIGEHDVQLNQIYDAPEGSGQVWKTCWMIKQLNGSGKSGSGLGLERSELI